ncbi:hypothetical protein [Achromobacter ruhlandii]|uniref:hypothetical protein n=1 Tax=Achromobacter ruhlandii TaxID=72557 RepID=UPI001EEF1261|nr:hypothetical protein [Achromobacter ruhlandii]
MNEKFGWTAALTAYAFALSGLYIFAFWRPFGISAFEFYSLQDYVSSTLNRGVMLIIYPLGIGLAISAFFLAIGWAENSPSVASNCFIGTLVAFVSEAVKVIRLRLYAPFSFLNEWSVTALILVLALGAFLAYIAARRRRDSTAFRFGAIAILQGATFLAAGYADGKTIYQGADNVFFLEDKTLCDKSSPRDWVYVASLGGRSIFMNTIDKRLCFTDVKNYVLISRVRREQLR